VIFYWRKAINHKISIVDRTNAIRFRALNGVQSVRLGDSRQLMMNLTYALSEHKKRQILRHTKTRIVFEFTEFFSILGLEKISESSS
jgi:hypothetical protein